MEEFGNKIQDILDSLDSNNYKLYGGDRDEALNDMEYMLMSFPSYVNTVTRNEIMNPIWRERYEGQDLRDHLMSADQRRRTEHDHVISSIEQLNRLSAQLGLEPFADINTQDRYQVADFAGYFVSSVFYDGTAQTMDRAVEQHKEARKDISQKDVKEYIEELERDR